MDHRLQHAIEHDDVDELYRIIVEDRKLLDRVSMDPFPNTPLHVAAAAGKTQVAMEVAILKPSIAWQLDGEGYSPLHLALQHEHYQTVRALITLDPKLIQVRGRCGITPLHYLAEKEGDNELELLSEFLWACKSSIEVLTSRCETAVDIAVKNYNLKAFEILFGWLNRVQLTEILDWKDQNGNTVFHIAASEKQQPKIIKLLIGYIKVDAKNFQNKTALEIFKDNLSGNQDLAKKLRRRGWKARLFNRSLPLSAFLRNNLSSFERFTYWFGLQDKSARDMILVVATLITTTSYQTALTPPGGFWQDNSSTPRANSTVLTANSSGIAIEKPHQARDFVMTGSNLHKFTALNRTVFLASIITILFTAIPLLPHTTSVYFLMLILSISYFTTATIGFPKYDAVAAYLIVGFYMSLLSLGLMLPLKLWFGYSGFRCQVDATGRRIGNFLDLKDWK